ncbi:MAG: hypothetical protein V1798_10485 [Pseudomonadota bacterium]
MKRVFFGFAAACLMFGAFIGCSSSSSGDSAGGSTNALSETYPSDLAVTSPFAASSSANQSRLAFRALEAPPTDQMDVMTFEDRREELSQRLEATDVNTCGFTLGLFRQAPIVSCYGPAINFSGHPDGSGSSGQLPPLDLGIWDENEGSTGEACISAKVNSLVASTQAQVDTATNLITAMLCIANVNGSDALPAAGETKDYLTDIAGADLPFEVTTATVERLEDSSDGKPVYQTTIIGSSSFDTREITAEIHLRHIPVEADNSAYRGRLWYTISGDVGQGGNCGQGGPKLFAVSILYSKTTAGILSYRMQRAQYCSDTAAQPFAADFSLDGANKSPGEGGDGVGWSGDYNDATFEINVENGTGRFAYAWQAGPNDGNTRAFIAELTAGDDGTISGCGYFGYGPDAASADIGEISGMICNWAGPGNSHNPMTAKVQRQCVTRNADGKFVSDSDLLGITYAPANSCDSAGGDFVFDGISGAVTNNLVDIGVMQADVSVPDRPPGL